VDTLGLVNGHRYRLQFMVHDGDQNKNGGDIGENFITLTYTTNSITPPPPPPPPNGLPSPWQTSDIGTVKLAGSATYASNTFTVAGSGDDIGGPQDAFRYVYQAANGDCSVIARVVSLQNTDPNAKAGVMIRDGLGATAMDASVLVTPATGPAGAATVNFVYRSRAGTTPPAPPAVTVSKPGQKLPVWVKIVRSGNAFTGYYSANGTTWTAVGAATTISMSSTPSIGLAVTSHKNDPKGATLCTAVFDNVTATP